MESAYFPTIPTWLPNMKRISCTGDKGVQAARGYNKPIHHLNERFIRILATGFGSGLSPVAPGTAGTLVGIPIYLAFSQFSWPLWLITVLALTALGWYASDEAERIFDQKDAQCIVIDEIAGIQWTLFMITPTLVHVVLGFALFRLFDIVKPFPARLFQDKLSGGCGVVADDLAAGVYGNIVIQILIYWLKI
jgi:phosphatidylglycerophosphatase A